VIWVVDGDKLTLKDTIANTGAMATGLALDAEANRIYTTNADGNW
jgi:DNA-binding beta-propeller fold protein YncE